VGGIKNFSRRDFGLVEIAAQAWGPLVLLVRPRLTLDINMYLHLATIVQWKLPVIHFLPQPGS
jgi:hypothetical protein